MRVVARLGLGAARMGQLALGAAAVHLLLLWLWNPRVEVAPPLRASGKPQREGADVVVVLGGDTAPADRAVPLLRRYGFEYPFSATLEITRESDLTLVNLETVVSEHDTPFPLYKNYSYRTEPAALAALKWAGVDAVSLANNHIMDHGAAGLLDTLEHLRAAGISAVGAGVNASAARRGVIFELRGTRLGVLAYLEDSFMDSLYTRSFAWGPDPGCARLELAHVYADIRRMRRLADIVVVTLHWGRTYEGVTLVQQVLAPLIVDAGADLVVGHHPHVHHPVGLSGGKPVLFSLGNFAFGTEGREKLRYGLLARVLIRARRLRRIELLPLSAQNRIVQFKPEPLVGVEARRMLTALARDSARYGAHLRVEGDRALLDL